MAVTDSVNKGRPPLRTWELNATSTRFDHLLAAPSDQALQHYWMAWAGIALFVGVFILVVFLGVISSKTARRHTFNLYLIYLMIPDCLFSLLCGTTCLLNALAGEYWSHAMCNFQQFYCVWGIGSNTWLNAAITRELHKLLRDSRHRKRYILPGAWQVSRQCGAIYLYTAFIATWGLIESPKFPFYAAAPSGLACIPVEADRRSAFFFWLVFFPLFAGLPTCYVFYACYDVWKHQLLPPTGKRRLLVIYFGRVILVFLSVWVPYFVLLFCFATLVPPWVHFAGGTLAHLQGITSAIVSMMKPDIFLAVKQFVLCRRRCCCGCCSTRTSRHGGAPGSSDAFDWRWHGGGSSFIVSRRHADADADAARRDGGGVIESINKNNGGDGDGDGDGGGPPHGTMSTLSLDFEVGRGGAAGPLAATHDDHDNELGLQDLSLHSFAEVGSVVETESYLTSSCSLWPNEDGEYDDDDDGEASLSPLPNPPATGMTSSSSRMMTMIPPPLSLVLEESSGSQHCSQRGGGGGSSSSGSAGEQSSIRDDGPASLSVGSLCSQHDNDDRSSDGSYHHHHHYPGQSSTTTAAAIRVMISDETSSNGAAARRVVSPDDSRREEDNSLSSSSSDTPAGANDIGEV